MGRGAWLEGNMMNHTVKAPLVFPLQTHSSSLPPCLPLSHIFILPPSPTPWTLPYSLSLPYIHPPSRLLLFCIFIFPPSLSLSLVCILILSLPFLSYILITHTFLSLVFLCASSPHSHILTINCSLHPVSIFFYLHSSLFSQFHQYFTLFFSSLLSHVHSYWTCFALLHVLTISCSLPPSSYIYFFLFLVFVLFTVPRTFHSLPSVTQSGFHSYLTFSSSFPPFSYYLGHSHNTRMHLESSFFFILSPLFLLPFLYWAFLHHLFISLSSTCPLFNRSAYTQQTTPYLLLTISQLLDPCCYFFLHAYMTFSCWPIPSLVFLLFYPLIHTTVFLHFLRFVLSLRYLSSSRLSLSLFSSHTLL